MTFFDICMITIILNFIFKIKVNIDIYKSFADKGYIFNNRLLKEMIRNELVEESVFNQLIYEFKVAIPFYNIFMTCLEKIEYCTYTDDYIDNFKEYFIIEKMTLEELNKYKMNKTGFHALLMRKKLNKKRQNLSVVAYQSGNSIWFDYNSDKLEEENLFDSIVIREARGQLERKSVEELKQMVYKSHYTVAEAVLNTYDDPEKFLDKYDKDKNITLNIENKKTDNIQVEKEYFDNTSNKSASKRRVRKR